MKSTIEWYSPKEKLPEYSGTVFGKEFSMVLILLESCSQAAEGDYTDGEFCYLGHPIPSERVLYWAYLPQFYELKQQEEE